MTNATNTPPETAPAYTGEADEFEGGLVPSQAPEPLAVVEARAAEEAAKKPVVPADVAAKLSALTPAELQLVFNAANASMREELGALRAELDAVKAGVGKDGMLGEDNASVGGYPWVYWRKPANWPDKTSRSWISAGPGGSTPKGNRDNGQYNILVKKGMTPITRYGFIEPPTTEHGVAAFMPILQKGGALEFPADQVIAYRWHVAPPIRGLKFPQYEAVKDTVKHFDCEECGKDYWFLPAQARDCAREYRGHLITGHKVPWREAAEAVARTGLKLRASEAGPATSVEDMMKQEAPV